MTDPIRRPGSRAERRKGDEPPPDGCERRRTDVPPVEVEWQNELDGIVVTLKNPLVVGNCFPVRDKLQTYVRKFTTKRITIDLAGVPFADSIGVGVLAEIRAMCLQSNKKLLARNATPQVRQILEMLDLDRYLFADE